METLDPILLQAWQKGFAKPERLSVQDFAARYISLPASYAVPGRVDLTRSRYLLPVLEALADPRVRIVLVKAAVQTGKSLLADLFVPWVIANAPGNILWLTCDEDLAKKYSESRVNPILHSTEPVKRLLPLDRFAKRRNSILFANHTSLIIGGANVGNLQSLSVRVLVGDEVWLWKAGHLQQFLYRAAAFPNTSKALIISQAGREDHDFSVKWKTGHCASWGWTCPHCGQLQAHEFSKQRDDGSFSGVTWDKNERTKPDKEYNLLEVAKTARLQCFSCKGDVSDTPKNRRALNDSGAYLVENPNADPAVKSFTWPAWSNIDIALGKVVTDYLQAKHSLDSIGYSKPLEEFQTKTLAKDWSLNLSAHNYRAALASYDVNADWQDEAHRFLTIDVQADCFWYVIRAWAKNGESRLLAFGRLETWEQLRELQLKWAIKDQKVFVDCGYDTTNVFAKCVEFGHWGKLGSADFYFCWNALKGSHHSDFPHTTPQGRKERQIYSQPSEGNPGLGKFAATQRCKVFLFSSDSANDILQHHFRGRGAKFLTNKEDAEYTAQMNSEVKRPIADPKTGKITSWSWVATKRDNHIRDCEKMQIVAARMVNCIGDNLGPKTETEPSQPAEPQEATL